MPGFKRNLTALGDTLGPAPSWGEFGGEVAAETLGNVPPMLGVGGLLGAGVGAGVSSLAGGRAGHGARVGAGAGLGGVGGMAAGSAIAQALAKLGGPMFKLNPSQTHALMHHANFGGSVAGGLLGATAGGYTGHKTDKEAGLFGIGDPGRNAIPGANLVKRRTGAVDAIEKLQKLHAAATAGKVGLGGKQPPAAPAPAVPVNTPQTIGSWLTPEMQAQMDANVKKSALRKIAVGILDTIPGYTGKHMIESGKGYSNLLPYAGLSAALGGGAGYLLGDPAAGAGGGAGAVLGGAAGNIAGTGLGAMAGGALGRHMGLNQKALQTLMDQWAHGGSHVGNVLGSLYGGYKGIGLARRIADDRSGKEAAARTLYKMAQTILPRRLSLGAGPPAGGKIITSPPAKLAPETPKAKVAPETKAPETKSAPETPAAAAAEGLPPGATPPVKEEGKGMFSGWKMPQMGGGEKALLYGGLGAIGLGALGSLGYEQGRRTITDRETDLRNEMSRDFLRQQNSIELERQRAMVARLSNIYA